VIYSELELRALDLEMYTTLRCRCVETRFEVVRIRQANGASTWRLQCTKCRHVCAASILHAKLPKPVRDEARLVRNAMDPSRRCARCGSSSKGVELHHWEPRDVFDDFDEWPKSWLCPECHKRWHERMDGYRRRNRPAGG
jgi:hypothetical protein